MLLCESVTLSEINKPYAGLHRAIQYRYSRHGGLDESNIRHSNTSVYTVRLNHSHYLLESVDFYIILEYIRVPLCDDLYLKLLQT